MKDGFDLRIKRSLQRDTARLQPSEDMLLNIRREAERRKKEKNDMTFKMKKLVAIAAAFCLVCMTCYAAVEIGNYESHSTVDIATYDQLSEAEKEAGFEFKRVEAFSNGFRFSVGGVSESTMDDKDGKRIAEAKGVNVAYMNDEGKYASLFVMPKRFYEEDGEGCPAGYSSDIYKFVPVDYQLTDEDKRMMEEGDFFVSYGSDEVEIVEVENYYWEDGGLVYSLMASGCGLGEEELAAMAREIMG